MKFVLFNEIRSFQYFYQVVNDVVISETERSEMRIVTAFNKKVCVGVFAILFTSSIGYMLGSLHSVEILEEKAKMTDKLNQAELELFEAERQLVHCDSELGIEIYKYTNLSLHGMDLVLQKVLVSYDL